MEEIVEFYARYPEATRLTRGAGLLESARMRELLARHLPPPPAVVLDVGGGPGAYSAWLAREGYEVHLIDPVTKHVEQARRVSDGQPDHPIASVTEGDARLLPHAAESCDAVLLMGPLYHLTEPEERHEALVEAQRVLKPGGMVFIEVVNRFASLMDGLVSGFIDDPYFVQILEQDLADGQHRNPQGEPDYFTSAFFHRPEELESEIEKAGFALTEMVAVQGPGWLAKNLEERWADAERREQILRLVRSVERERSLWGVSQHLAAVATK